MMTRLMKKDKRSMLAAQNMAGENSDSSVLLHHQLTQHLDSFLTSAPYESFTYWINYFSICSLSLPSVL